MTDPDAKVELVARAKALLKAGVSPWPWKVHGGGLRTVNNDYLSEGMGAWSSPRGSDMRDRDLELASLAPELAEALVAALEASSDTPTDQGRGVPASPSGHSAKPEPISVVSAETASVPNAETRAAIAAGEQGAVKRFSSVDELFAELQQDDAAEWELARLYSELVFSVSKNREGESRHETALRYIREREAQEALPIAKRNHKWRGSA